MPITPQQARAELARRELIRRESTPQTFQQQGLEQRISQRPDIYSQAVQGIQQRFSPEGQRGFTFPQEANIGLQSLGGVMQRGEAAIANPFLRKQGQFQNPITAIKEGITGQQLGELGDVARQAGLPEPISAVLGLAGTAFLGGAISKWAGLSQKANNLTKLQTSYGKDISKTIIKHTTGLSDEAVEHGMKRGWRNVLTKENLDPEIPTRIASRLLNNLDEITQKEYDEFGKAIDKITTGNVKAIDLNQKVQDVLLREGYIDSSFNPTMKFRGSVANKVFDFIEKATKSGIKPDDNIPVSVIRDFKKIIKGYIPEKNLLGKMRSLKGEQRFAKDLANQLDDLISYNAYGVEDEVYAQAKRRYSEFKNFEKYIIDSFTNLEGQELKPTAKNIVNLTSKEPTLVKEEIGQLKNLDEFLKSKGYSPVTNKLLDWNTVKEFLVKPRVGGLFEKIGEVGKFGVRQTLKSGIPTMVGGTAGKIMNAMNPLTIPPSILRIITGRNKE